MFKLMNNINDLLCCYVNLLENNNFLFSIRRKQDKYSTNYLYEKTALFNSKKELVILHDILPTMCHNISVTKYNNTYYAIGGCSFIKNEKINYLLLKKFKYCDGLYITKSTNMVDWESPKLIIDREWGLKNECCSFDSQPCIFFYKNKHYLYIRHNPRRGIRKIQVFISNNIDKWNNNAQLVNTGDNINIYNAYVFIVNDIFYAISRYYTGDNYNNKDTYTTNCLMKSNDGINFDIINKNFVDFNNYGYVVNNSIHEKDGFLHVYFSTREGIITEHKLFID